MCMSHEGYRNNEGDIRKMSLHQLFVNSLKKCWGKKPSTSERTFLSFQFDRERRRYLLYEHACEETVTNTIITDTSWPQRTCNDKCANLLLFLYILYIWYDTLNNVYFNKPILEWFLGYEVYYSGWNLLIRF